MRWTPPGRVIWAVNGDDRSNGPICSDAHETLKKEKNGRMRVAISRMRRHSSFEPIDTDTCMRGGVPDLINRAKFSEKRPKGFSAGRPQNMAFYIDFAGRPYNTLTLPCERVIGLSSVKFSWWTDWAPKDACV